MEIKFIVRINYSDLWKNFYVWHPVESQLKTALNVLTVMDVTFISQVQTYFH